jgi:hypothetical protein
VSRVAFYPAFRRLCDPSWLPAPSTPGAEIVPAKPAAALRVQTHSMAGASVFAFLSICLAQHSRLPPRAILLRLFLVWSVGAFRRANPGPTLPSAGTSRPTCCTTRDRCPCARVVTDSSRRARTTARRCVLLGLCVLLWFFGCACRFGCCLFLTGCGRQQW